ncbi:MAG: matrixin family metalloprotease, partial [Myxococcota bacterium]
TRGYPARPVAVDVHDVERTVAVSSRLSGMQAHCRAGILVGLGLALTTSSSALAFECTPATGSTFTQAWNQRCVPYWIRSDDGLFAGSELEALVVASFNRWSLDVEETDFELVFAGYTDQGAGFDNTKPDEQQNVVVSVSGDEATEIFGNNLGFLAVTLTSFSTETGEIFDADIIFNIGRNPFAVVDGSCNPAQADAPFDIENTLVHEIGHVLGFDHVTDPEATMFDTAAPCETKKRTLEADDLAAVQTVYPSGSPPATCRPPPNYEGRNGDPSAFRDQCERATEDGCGCSTASGAPGSGAMGAGLMLLGALVLRRRRR